jgi:hypothetical protein
MLTQAFLDQWKHVPIPPRLRVDDAARGKASVGKSRREQIASGQAPENGAIKPSGDPSSEEGSRASKLSDRPCLDHLMHSAAHQPTARQVVIDSGYAERQCFPGA